MCPSPIGLGFLRRFSLKTGVDFAHFSLESGTVIERTTGLYERIHRFNSKWGRKKEKYSNSKLIMLILRKFSCSCSNLSDDEVIS